MKTRRAASVSRNYPSTSDLTAETKELFENAGRFSEFAQSNGITFTPERLVNLNGRKEDTVSFERQFK